MDRRHLLYLAGGGVALALDLARPAMSPVVAQEGAAESGMTAEGAIFEPLAFGTTAVAPSAPAVFQLARIRIAPGGRISVPADDPGLVLIYAEAGTMTCVATVETVSCAASYWRRRGAHPLTSSPPEPSSRSSRVIRSSACQCRWRVPQRGRR